MSSKSLLSRCGIYCGACYVYRAHVDGGEFLKEVAEWQGVRPEDVRCGGCTGPKDELWVNCAKCGVHPCLEEKDLDFCYQCSGFQSGTCEYYSRIEEFCARRGEDVRAAMEATRVDPEAWLREQDSRWRCGSCGGPYSWYEASCHHCGSDLGRTDLSP